MGTVYKGYRIGYELQGQNYQFETRLGIVDAFGSMRGLPVGADIPLLINPMSYDDPLINTFNGRYAMTQSFSALLGLFGMIVLVAIIRGGGRKSF